MGSAPGAAAAPTSAVDAAAASRRVGGARSAVVTRVDPQATVAEVEASPVGPVRARATGERYETSTPDTSKEPPTRPYTPHGRQRCARDASSVNFGRKGRR